MMEMDGCERVIRLCRKYKQFEFQRFELAYRTLDQAENRRLCKIGRCRICGGRLCLGGPLPGQSSADSLLEEIYRWMLEQWDARTERLPDGVDCFRDLFLSMFHAPDRDFVCEWLNRRGREGE